MAKQNAPRAAQRKKGKKRVQEPPHLGISGGYVKDPRYGLGKDRRYTGEHGEAEPAGVYPDDQDRFTKESENRFALMRAREFRVKKAHSIAGKARSVVAEANKLDVDLPQLEQIDALLDQAFDRVRRAA